ncbi:hypothetical protein OE88DRAFT_1727018 [Heliocybe sulcata]|uniref:Uncharacterized protein n=1 Tax=Heliocybe sulcata TaxID=5364 RepID=A0A5C3MWI2_9AGAM|nr:hypothetical protein OE88DRAFT_1727018 [Heliocybe sulcata]
MEPIIPAKGDGQNQGLRSRAHKPGPGATGVYAGVAGLSCIVLSFYFVAIPRPRYPPPIFPRYRTIHSSIATLTFVWDNILRGISQTGRGYVHSEARQQTLTLYAPRLCMEQAADSLRVPAAGDICAHCHTNRLRLQSGQPLLTFGGDLAAPYAREDGHAKETFELNGWVVFAVCSKRESIAEYPDLLVTEAPTPQQSVPNARRPRRLGPGVIRIDSVKDPAWGPRFFATRPVLSETFNKCCVSLFLSHSSVPLAVLGASVDFVRVNEALLAY